MAAEPFLREAVPVCETEGTAAGYYIRAMVTILPYTGRFNHHGTQSTGETLLQGHYLGWNHGDVPDDTAAETWLKDQRWPDGMESSIASGHFSNGAITAPITT